MLPLSFLDLVRLLSWKDYWESRISALNLLLFTEFLILWASVLTILSLSEASLLYSFIIECFFIFCNIERPFSDASFLSNIDLRFRVISSLSSIFLCKSIYWFLKLFYSFLPFTFLHETLNFSLRISWNILILFSNPIDLFWCLWEES